MAARRCHRRGTDRPLQRRLLDQIAYRFGKLQGSLGEKVLPGLLLVAQEPVAPEATFVSVRERRA